MNEGNGWMNGCKEWKKWINWMNGWMDEMNQNWYQLKESEWKDEWMGGLEKMDEWMCIFFPIISLLIFTLLSKTDKKLAIGKHNNIITLAAALTLIILFF